MATYTDNYQLAKPVGSDEAKISVLNGNSDTIDTIMHASQVSIAEAYDATRTSSNPYNAGDKAMYEFFLYECQEDGVYGAWDATKWARAYAAESGGGGGFQFTTNTEVNTGNKWINGEDIWVYCFNYASTMSAGTDNANPSQWGLSTSGITAIVKAEVYIVESRNGTWIPATVNSVDQNYTKGQINFTTTAAGKPYLILYYTKG